MAEPPVVRMFNEYTFSWPFWGENGLPDQEDFPLPLKLTKDVLVWTRNFDHERGWPTAEQREASRRVPLTLPRVELRKQVDTRAGRGLLIAIGVLTALALGLLMWVARNDGAPLSAALAVTTTPRVCCCPCSGSSRHAMSGASAPRSSPSRRNPAGCVWSSPNCSRWRR